MNCPHHHHIYLSRPRSYRDLPLRLSEFGQVYRYEASGGLSGMMRTRGFCQNDAHIYCTFDQAKEEFKKVMAMHADYYEFFGIEDFYMRLSLPDLDKLDKYVDEPEKWIAALKVIYEAMEESGLPYKEVKGEAAFYGPKIDFNIKSAVGVEYTISTNQLDFLATDRFNLTYKGSDGEDHPVYVIHRAPLGSHERFVAFLIEHYNACFPIWLAPEQIVIVPVSDKYLDYADNVNAKLRAMTVANGTWCVRSAVDSSSERMQKKIRNWTMRKVPLIAVVGEAEAEAGTLAIRTRDGVDYGTHAVDAFMGGLKQAIEARDDQVLWAQLST